MRVNLLIAVVVSVLLVAAYFWGYQQGRNSAFDDMQQDWLLKRQNKKFMQVDTVCLKVKQP